MTPETESDYRSFDAAGYIDTIGHLEDSEISIALAVLALCSIQNERPKLDQYLHHLHKVSKAVAQRYKDLLAGGAEDDASTRLASLKHILADQENYVGDEQGYSNIDSFDMLRSIDRRSGSSIILSILYMHVARQQGWVTYGIDFPCRFLLCLDYEDTRLLVDVADGCKILQASDLRGLVKKHLGENAELSAHYYEPSNNREILINLFNAIKSHQIVYEDYSAALSTVLLMRRVAPEEHRLFFDAGILYAKTDDAQSAILALEQYIESEPAGKDRQDAVLLLQQIREDM